jgi:hypothetical protein
VPVRDHPLILPFRRRAGRYAPTRLALKLAADRGLDWVRAARGVDTRLDRLATTRPVCDVLIVGIEWRGTRMARAIAELQRSGHRTRVVLGTMADTPGRGLEAVTVLTGLRGPKFVNVNLLLAHAAEETPAPRWTIVIDDDVILPRCFLDRFLAACEALNFVLAQPALTLRSYESHPVTRRHLTAVARETRFVEIGPLTAFRAEANGVLVPFPEDAGMGWALDSYWPVLAAERDWRIGIIDAVPVGHQDAPPASTYSRSSAIDEAEAFLATRPRIDTDATWHAIRTHHRLP